MMSLVKKIWLDWLVLAILAGLCLAEMPGEPSVVGGGGSLFFVLIDRSGSMGASPADPAAAGWRARKIDEVRRQLGEFFALAPDDSGVAVFAFDTELVAGPTFTPLTDGLCSARPQFADRRREVGLHARPYCFVQPTIAVLRAENQMGVEPCQ